MSERISSWAKLLMPPEESEASFDEVLPPDMSSSADAERGAGAVLAAGTVLGNYRVLKQLGRGGMGEVYLAEDTRLDREAAIKLLPVEFGSDSMRRQRFIAEAKAASALNHPNICVIYDVGETDDGLPFIVMEFVDGDPLDVLLQQGPIEIAAAVTIAAQVADALDAAHTVGIVHRDIKPANICLNARGQVKVLDFGLAKRLTQVGAGGKDAATELHLTQDGQLLGTPLYMSPEQALSRALDHRSDLFSLGGVLYEMTTGQRPFRGSGFGEIVNSIVKSQPQAMARFNYDVPAELERITLKCLQKSLERRYQSARELMVDLKSLAGGLDLDASASVSSADADWLIDTTNAGDSDPLRGSSASAVTEPVSLEALKTSDIVLNYAAIDDQPLLEGRPGWVSQLHRNLEVRVEQVSGEKVKIARIPKASGSSVVDARVLEKLPEAKAMISVISPPFIKSSACQTEVEHFWRCAERRRGQWAEDKPRLLKVIKTAVSSQEMPPALAEILSPLFGFEFFEVDPNTGRVREFDETFGPALKQRFFDRVYDLAYDVCEVLRTLRRIGADDQRSQAADETRHWVYLATTTSDIQDERDRIRRELLERGHVVLPDAPLPMISQDAEAAVHDCLEKCTIAVHLLGRHYGMTPEDSAESIPALQVRLTAEQTRNQELQRVVWMPGNGETVDERQQQFIARVQEDPGLHQHAEIIEGNLNLLKKDLIRRLAPPEAKPTEPLSRTAANSAPKLYLICDPRDEADIEALEDYLFSQGLEVSLPAFDGSDADAEALHQDNLLTCDAVLVYYGAAPKAWVDIKLRELLKAAGYGREAPIDLKAVYVAPPDDHRKKRFRSHQAHIIRQPQDFSPLPELDEFVDALRRACG